jgi:hypothetical protein
VIEPCQVCVELGRAGIDLPCSVCDEPPMFVVKRATHVACPYAMGRYKCWDGHWVPDERVFGGARWMGGCQCNAQRTLHDPGDEDRRTARSDGGFR